MHSWRSSIKWNCNICGTPQGVSHFFRAVTDRPLCCGFQHIFNENAVARCGVIHKDMGHSTDEFPILDDG